MNLQSQLQTPYSRDAWLGLLRTLFSTAAELFAKPVAIADPGFHGVFTRVLHLGDLKTTDNKTAALLDIEVAPDVLLPRNRAGIRHLAARLIDGTQRQGILAAFHSGTSPDWRFSFIAREKTFDIATGATACRETPARRFTYLLGPAETCRTAAERFATLQDQAAGSLATFANLETAFSVEKLSDAFFTEYIGHYETFAKHAARFAGARDWQADTESARNARHFSKRLLARLVFLHFLQKKHWIGCSPASAPAWADGDTDFLHHRFQSCPDPERFHTACLIPLFYETLNSRRPNDIFRAPGRPVVRIPYLNGGLFEENPAEKPFRSFDFPAKLFQDLFDLFSRFNFTIDESDPLDIEIGVDPEMLGRIFEALLEDNKEKGAYYTPKAIVAYMCQEALIRYLAQGSSSKGSSSFQLEALNRKQDACPTGSKQDACPTGSKQDACSTVFFHPHVEVEISRRNLPHWCQRGVMYFVTFRLADSLPKERVQQLLQERETWQKLHREPLSDAERREYAELFSERVENWLDAGSGSCCLAQPGPAEAVANALRHFDGDRYVLDEWVVMPNHVHVLVTPLGNHALSDILHSWKSFTANQINKARGTSGQLWQHESYDHIVRSERQLHHFRQYIRENPKGITVAQASCLRTVGQASCLPPPEVTTKAEQTGCLPTQDAQAGSLSYVSAIENFIRHQDPVPASLAPHLDALLRDIKICDPAIGSGAFPMGMLQEIVRARLALNPKLDPAALKAHTIQNSIYGVDLDSGAVDIARLRFWLSLVVDEKEPRPLPNLDYKIMQGNSLLESFEGVDLSKFVTHSGVITRIDDAEQLELLLTDQKNRLKQQTLAFREATAASIDKLVLNYFDTVDPNTKKELRQQIDAVVRQHIEYNFTLKAEQYETAAAILEAELDRRRSLHKDADLPKQEHRQLEKTKAELRELPKRRKRLEALQDAQDRPYFLWHLFFHDVFAAGGFDVVIGNPPYVRQETIKDAKPALKAEGYKCFDGVADLLVYFYERGVTLLRDGGTIALITSNKFYRAGYGEKLREFLANELTLHNLIDFGDAPVFAAIAYASILTGTRAAPACDASALAYTWEKGVPVYGIASIMTARGRSIRQCDLTPESWRLESPVVLRLMAKLRREGKPLGDYVENRFFYGIKTGLNKAFVVDRTTRDRLICENKSSADVLKPFLRGRDLKRWRIESPDLWLLFVPWHFPLHEDPTISGSSAEAEEAFRKWYPAIYQHLVQFKKELSARNTEETGIRYEWYALQRCAAEYWRDFEHTKIIYPDIYEHQSFAWDASGYFVGNTCYFIPTSEKWMAGLLNSRTVEWFYSNVSNKMRGGYLRAFSDYMRQIPIPAATPKQQSAITDLVDRILAAKAVDPTADVSALETEIDMLVYDLYDLAAPEITIVEGRQG